MKIRTVDELYDSVGNDFTWRKWDMIKIRALIIQNRNTVLEATYLRAAVPLIYAHWEGYVKEAALCYINFITLQKLPYKDLNKAFIMLHTKERFINAGISNLEKAERLYEFFINGLAANSNLKSIPEPIDTKSNLNSEALFEIFTLIGLDYIAVAPYEKFIDSILLNNRNKIAHGEYNSIDFETYDEIHQKTMVLLVIVKDMIQNAAILKEYLN